MVELIKGLIQVRDALTLVAFLSLVLLVAFRTPKVPELFFGLLSNKLTREQFSRLFRRFMVLGFLGFLLLVGLAALAQVLNNKTQPGTVTLNDLRHELSKVPVPEENKLRAESNFGTGLELMSRRDLDRAIASLQKSLQAAPTLTAQEMLAFLFWQKRDFESANASWVAAMKLARERGDSVAQVRLDRILTPPSPRNEVPDTTAINTSAPKSVPTVQISPSPPALATSQNRHVPSAPKTNAAHTPPVQREIRADNVAKITVDPFWVGDWAAAYHNAEDPGLRELDEKWQVNIQDGNFPLEGVLSMTEHSINGFKNPGSDTNFEKNIRACRAAYDAHFSYKEKDVLSFTATLNSVSGKCYFDIKQNIRGELHRISDTQMKLKSDSPNFYPATPFSK